MSPSLRSATLSAIAEELSRRATINCPTCGGFGEIRGGLVVGYRGCPICGGTGRQTIPELERVATEMSALAASLHT